MPVSLRVQQLACTAGTRVLFDELSFELAGGQCLLLVGPNGSGKTTLLRALAGLARPSQGTIAWGAPAAGLCLYQGHQSGWKSEFSALENLTTQCQLDGLRATVDTIEAALERVGIGAQAHLPFARLSAGQRRRIALARLALDSRPVWLLDEPATALDDQGVRLLASLIDAQLNRDGLVITATHQELGLARPPLRRRLAPLETAISS